MHEFINQDQEFKDNLIRDSDYIRFKNESYNHYLASSFKNLNYFSTNQKSVIFIDSKLKIEKRYTISRIKETFTESLGINIKKNEVSKKIEKMRKKFNFDL